jgi:hypothetical protein
MSKKNYQILVPQENIVYKDDGKRIVLFLVDLQDENHTQTFSIYKVFIYTQLLDILLNLNYDDSKRVYEDIRKAITELYDAGAAEDLCNTLLSALYVANTQTGEVIFNSIEDSTSIIKWGKNKNTKIVNSIRSIHIERKWIYFAASCLVIGVMVGVFMSTISGWFDNSDATQATIVETNQRTAIQKANPKLKINAIYDPKSCTIYFSDTKFEKIEYYIDYQKRVKSLDDINWRLQSNNISSNDTLFLKDNCTVYLRGEVETDFSEIQVIDVSYFDFITQLLATQDPLIKSMLVTNSPTVFGNTTFLVDSVPQQVSYYKSSELRDYIKNGFKVTSIKTIGSNLNPTNKHYPKLSQITIQKQ